MSLKLQKYFKLDNENWYIDSDDDMHIELPYNVYVDYVSDKKVTKNNIKEFLNIKLSSNEINKLTNKKSVININYEYETNDGKLVSGEMMLGAKKDKNNNVKFDANYLTDFYCTLGNYATLTAGQHDYDEAMRKEDEEFAKLGVSENTLTNTWSTNDNEQYEISSVLTVEDIYKIAIDGYSKSTASDAKANKEKLEKDLENYLNGKK